MLKYSLGLDISALEFHACISVIDKVQNVTVKSTRKFDNTKGGFANLDGWISANWKQRELPFVACMEATGAYHENCAMYLQTHGYNVSVVLPNIAKKYLQSLGLKSKNDKIDAKGLARMGAEQSLALWEPLTEYSYLLRGLTRQHQDLTEQDNSIGSQMHANEHGMHDNILVIEQMKGMRAYIGQQIKAMAMAIADHIASDLAVSKKVENICKIKGVGLLTAAVLLAETNCFASFKNAPQLVSYAGYDVVENQSGTQKGGTRISKRGNSSIRRILFMPAFCVVTHNQKKISSTLY